MESIDWTYQFAVLPTMGYRGVGVSREDNDARMKAHTIGEQSRPTMPKMPSKTIPMRPGMDEFEDVGFVMVDWQH